MTSNFDAMPICNAIFIDIPFVYCQIAIAFFSSPKKTCNAISGKNIGPTFDVGISGERGLNVFAAFVLKTDRQLSENSFK